MKRFRNLKIGLIVCFALISLLSYSQEKDMKTHFATEVEAANKGKADMMEVMKSGQNINLGVKREELEGASAGKPITRMVVKFDNLLQLDNVKSLRSISEGETSTIVPFMKNGGVVTVVEVAKDKEGWTVVGLAGMSLSKDLNVVLRAASDKTLVVYEVPNLSTLIFTTDENGKETYYTSFNDKFSLRKGVSQTELYPELQRAAQDFQANYGDMIKKEKLVR